MTRARNWRGTLPPASRKYGSRTCARGRSRAYADAAGSAYASVRTYRAGDSVSPQAFPDVTLAVDDFMPPATGQRGETP